MPSSSLRVALVYDDSLDRFGGIPQYLSVLGAALMRAGHDVSLLVGESSADAAHGCRVHSLARNIRVRFNGNRLSVPMFADRQAIRSLARGGGFDIVHVQVPYSPVMAGHLIRRLPEATGLVGTFHVASERLVPRAGARALAAVTPASRHRFDEMICVSEHAARFARATYRVRGATVLPNMVELRAFRAPPRRPPEQPTVVSIGALVPRKGPLQLVDAFARLHADLPEARLRIAGDGPLRGRLTRKVRRLGLTTAVELLGPILEREKAGLLRDAHVACFPSRYGESFGVVLLEAMAVNGPAVLAGDNAGYREVLGDVPASLCHPDGPSFCHRIRELLVDDSQRRRLVAEQQQLVGRYDADVVVGRVLGMYRRAIARRRPRWAPDFAA